MSLNLQTNFASEINDFFMKENHDIHSFCDEESYVHETVSMERDACEVVGKETCLKAKQFQELSDKKKTKNISLNVQDDEKNCKSKKSNSIEHNNSLEKCGILTNKQCDRLFLSGQDDKSHEIMSNKKAMYDTIQNLEFQEDCGLTYRLTQNKILTTAEYDKNNTDWSKYNKSQILDEQELEHGFERSQNEFSTQVEYCTEKDSSSPVQDSVFQSIVLNLSNKYPMMSTDNLIKRKNLVIQQVNLEHTYSKLTSSPENKNSKNKKCYTYVKKKKYVTPCPSMKMIHEQSSNDKEKGIIKKKKESLIRNGTLSTMLRTINGKKYKIENTSIFDSIAEIMSVAYKNMKDFTEHCDNYCTNKHENCFVKIIMDYCKSENLTSFYKTRAHFLFDYAYVENDVISIRDSVGEFFLKIMYYNHWSYQIHTYCFECNEISYEYFTSITLSFTNSNSMQYLEQMLKEYFLRIQSKCDLCHDLGIPSVEFSFYLCIDVQLNNQLCQLSDVPENICLTDEDSKSIKFVLTGIISLQEDDEAQHIAYCRSISGHWDERKDISERIKHVKKLPEIKLVLLFYVRINS